MEVTGFIVRRIRGQKKVARGVNGFLMGVRGGGDWVPFVFVAAVVR